MDAPPIQYCRTDDGVNIAYWTLGERSNPALIFVPWGVTHLTAEWEIEPYRTWYARLARRFFLVAYDARGSGLSQRGVTDLALASYAGDIAAVAAHVELDRYILFAGGRAAMWSIVHAVHRPEAVSHLVLWTPIVSGSEYEVLPQHRAIGPAAEIDFAAWRQAAASIFTGHADASLANELAAMLDQATTADHYQAIELLTRTWDVRAELPKVQAKTLVFGVTDLGYAPVTFAQDAASAIPNARLIVAPDSVMLPQLGDRERYATEIEAFILEDFSPHTDRTHADAVTWEFTAAPPASPAPPGPKLSARELEVLRLIADGKSNPEIAEALVIAVGTVARHVSNMLAKTDLKNRVELATYAADHGLRSRDG